MFQKLWVPEFSALIAECGEKPLVWVALMHDYDSPYRHYSLKHRKKFKLERKDLKRKINKNDFI